MSIGQIAMVFQLIWEQYLFVRTEQIAYGDLRQRASALRDRLRAGIHPSSILQPHGSAIRLPAATVGHPVQGDHPDHSCGRGGQGGRHPKKSDIPTNLS
jgi:hypothetical protein